MLFQNKRKSLSKRLWRARLSSTVNNFQQQQQQQQSAMDTDAYPNTGIDGGGRNVFRDCCVSNNSQRNAASAISSRNIPPEDVTRYQMFLELIGNLKEKQLETLYTAITMELGCNDDLTSVKSDCVLVKKGFQTAEAHFIACQVWRWPNLQSHEELKRIPTCMSRQDPIYICCNPAHWSRVCETEAPPPPYNQIPMERLKDEHVQRYPGSLTYDGEGKNFIIFLLNFYIPSNLQ
uniref:CSON003084 protein n=1 Tax=Culicoides sonorensis TaxID=179676 RepID=A0A336L4U1_CULSO